MFWAAKPIWSGTRRRKGAAHGLRLFSNPLWFLVRLSRFLGFYPAGDYTAGAWFDMQEGHFSSAQPLHAAVINPSGAELLWRLMECEAERLCDIRLSRSDRTAFLDDILSYFGYHLDAMHTIRSVDILREVF